MNDVFTHRDILKVFPRLKARTLINWVERGLLVPEHGEASGRGSSRRYGYGNLIQIAALIELLRLGMPFAVIEGVLGGGMFKGLVERKGFDSVFYFRRELSLSDVPMDIAAPWIGTFGVVPYDEFLKIGGSLVLDAHERAGETLYGNPSTVLVLNLRGLQRFVDIRIKRAL